ncbi:hypothetical protein PsYK624_133560 [Phanerochaete sordida]|uniref:Uncharacterized protein n=1 Tax=Phanerochaete sordida TaxID=48140 RepID=A0A9P3GPJ6_9APHY|nr:hypothetical protein PsYK624_133560 [Phanerochaete sordida]
MAAPTSCHSVAQILDVLRTLPLLEDLDLCNTVLVAPSDTYITSEVVHLLRLRRIVLWQTRGHMPSTRAARLLAHLAYPAAAETDIRLLSPAVNFAALAALVSLLSARTQSLCPASAPPPPRPPRTPACRAHRARPSASGASSRPRSRATRAAATPPSARSPSRSSSTSTASANPHEAPPRTRSSATSPRPRSPRASHTSRSTPQGRPRPARLPCTRTRGRSCTPRA